MKNRTITEWHILASGVVAGQQPIVEQVLCDVYELDGIEEVTIGQLVDMLEVSYPHIVEFII